MNNFLRLLMHPSIWDKIYPTNQTVDRFVRMLIDNKDEVKILKRDDYTLTVLFKNRVFSLWIANRFYAYLNCIREHKVDHEKMTYNNYPYINEIDGFQPSRITMLDFYETFDTVEPKDKFQFLKEVIENDQHD